VFGVFDASTVFAMVTGALAAPILIEATSLEASFLILGAAALLVTFGAFLALRGLDAVSAERAEALAARIAVLESLPVTIGVPRLVLERLASTSEVRPVPSGVDIVVQGAPADAFYAVIDGVCSCIEMAGKNGHHAPARRRAELLEALVEAPMFRPALDLSSTAEGVQVPGGESPLVDDKGFVNV
jgi:hypothetical protein